MDDGVVAGEVVSIGWAPPGGAGRAAVAVGVPVELPDGVVAVDDCGLSTMGICTLLRAAP
jgi:hypothetical protein